jgi:hypothetical protein
MIKKMVVVMAASALACGGWASSASAKQHPKAKRAHVAKVEPIKSVPGNNPMVSAPMREPMKNAPTPQAIKGNNPMGVAAK